MNLAPITFELISERYEEIPERFRELLESPGSRTALARIGAQHALDSDRQDLLEALVGLVFLGFLSPEDLPGEFVERLFLNFVHARALAHEVDETFFAPHRRELLAVYNPMGGAPEEPKVRIAEQPMRAGGTVSLESIGRDGGALKQVPVSTPSTVSETPLVILGGSGQLPGRAGGTARVPVVPPPSFPERHLPRFPFRFPAQRQNEQVAGPSAVVRFPGSAPVGTKNSPASPGQPHVIHYTETRGKLGAPLPTGKEGVVRLDELGGPRPEAQQQAAPNQKPRPKLDGNVIDLRSERP